MSWSRNDASGLEGSDPDLNETVPQYWLPVYDTTTMYSTLFHKKSYHQVGETSVAEPEPVEPKLFWDLEPEPKINFNEHFLQSVWRMLE